MLALGTNDVGNNVPLDTMRAGVARLLGTAPHARWACITPPSIAREDTYRNALGLSVADYRAAIAEACAAAGAVVIEGDRIVPPHLIQPDGVHVAIVSHARLAREVARALEAE